MEVGYGREMMNVMSFLDTLSSLKKVTFVTTSNRSPFVEKKYGESPKSSQLADYLADALRRRGVKVDVWDGAKLKIYNSLGCVSEVKGNLCGVKASLVKDKEKNPHGHLRCWASHDFKDDELWKIVNSMYESQALIFFGSQRWGNVNAVYQKIIERMDWIENMHYTLGEKSTVSEIKTGLVLLGQNWRVQESLELQKEVLSFFGFQTPDPLFIGWQFTRDVYDETPESYKEAPSAFEQSWGVTLTVDKDIEKKDLYESNGAELLTFNDFLESLKNI
jgi:multimeric flavodoxin WrbA